MSDNRLLLILIIITLASLGLAGYLMLSKSSEVRIPVDGPTALELVKAEPTASAFIAENFGLPEDRIERVSLVWDSIKKTYMWEIEIQERSCGCMLNETEGVTILRVSVDPVSGALYNLTTRVGVPEDTIKREACEKGCHIQ